MNHLIINVGYVVDNQAIVNEMVEGLEAAGAHFNLVDSNNFTGNESFEEHLLTEGCPCLLMISDNFLKSINSLKNGLNYLQRLIKKEQVIPIIIDGVEIDSEGNRQIIPTEFEKVSKVIKYMNYWQEKYLDLRKLKRNISKEEEEGFAKKLKLVRGISSEVGEFLRNLRETNYYTIEEFSDKHYEAFFRNFGDETTYLKFVTAQKNEIPGEKTIKGNEILAEEPKPNFLPFDELLKEKEKLDPLSISVDGKEKEDTLIESIPNTSLKNEENVEDKNDLNQYEASLFNNDPEWEKAKYSEEKEESSLAQIAESEERPLTDTELLALELAEKLPISLEDVREGEVDIPEEEMISLEDLLGKDLMEETENVKELGLTEGKETQLETKNTKEEPEEKKDINLNELMEDNVAATEIKATKYEDDEEELEGYFVEEESELEEIEEEIIEIELIQSANTLVQSGKEEEAIALLEETLEIAPEFTALRYQYAIYLAKFNNNFKAASEQIAIVLEQEPNNLSAKFFLGELAEADRDYLSAKSYYEKVYNEEEAFPNVSYKLGILLVNQLRESPDEALNYLEKAYQLDANNINALYQLGLLQSEDESTQDRSIQSFVNVLEKAPEHPFANYDLALIYHRKGERTKALAFYEKAAIINPELRTKINDEAFAITNKNIRLEEKEEKEEIVESIPLEGSKLAIQPNQAGITTNEITNITESLETFEPILEPDKFEDEEASALTKEILLPPIAGFNKIALITGATSGIGKATALKFAKEGYKLILTGRRFSRLFKIKEQFEKNFDAKVKLLPFDIKNPDAVHRALTGLEEEWQSVDILVNNAGLARGESAIHLGELENWENMIDTNIKGLLYMTREIAPFMVKRKEGQIINVCSLAGKEVYPNNAVYCATKHAVDALTKAMRIDLHKYNIRVSQVSPGFVEDTEFAKIKKGLPANENSTFTDFVPINAMDVAAVIYFITTQPKHVTLQEIVLAGTQQASANFIDKSGR